LNRNGTINLTSVNAITGGGNIEANDLVLTAGTSVALGQVLASDLIVSASETVDIEQVSSKNFDVDSVSDVVLGSVDVSSTNILSSANVLINQLKSGTVNISADSDVRLDSTDTSGEVNIKSTTGDIILSEIGSLSVGTISSKGDSANIIVSAQNDLNFKHISTLSPSNGTVSVNVERGEIAASGDIPSSSESPDIVAGQIQIDSPLGDIGAFERPIVIESNGVTLLDTPAAFIGRVGATPDPINTGGLLSSGAFDLTSSSGLNSAVQLLINTLDTIDPGVFKNDELVEREETSLALPESQRRQ
jgi:hypothetical protein